MLSYAGENFNPKPKSETKNIFNLQYYLHDMLQY